MDEVEELIEQLARDLLADAYEAHGLKMTAAKLRSGSVHEDMLVALDALTKALTVSPEKLRNAARTLDPTAWRARDTKRDSVAYGRRRKASLRSVRAVAVELGLKVNG